MNTNDETTTTTTTATTEQQQAALEAYRATGDPATWVRVTMPYADGTTQRVTMPTVVVALQLLNAIHTTPDPSGWRNTITVSCADGSERIVHIPPYLEAVIGSRIAEHKVWEMEQAERTRQMWAQHPSEQEW